jgi:Lrp/AsnC family transcriptional regulator
VIECYILLGSTDVLLKIIVSDVNYYEELFYKKLSQPPGFREINSSVVLSEVKKSTCLPLGPL